MSKERPVLEARTPDRDAYLSAARVKQSRSPYQIAAVIIVLLLFAMFVHALVTQKNFQWQVVARYFFSAPILSGVRITVELTALSMCIGVVLGAGLAVMKSSGNGLLKVAANVYIWIFRGTPTLVQLIFWYNIAALLPTIGFGVPFGPTFFNYETNKLVTPIIAALLGLGLSQAAYTAEIIRGGIISVDPGQIEAAYALGLRKRDVLRRITLPQILPVIIPPIGNEVIGMLKYSSLVSVIAVIDLLEAAEQIYSVNFETIPLLVVAALWYLVLTTILTIIQGRIERHFSEGLIKGRSRRARRSPGSARYGAIQ